MDTPAWLNKVMDKFTEQELRDLIRMDRELGRDPLIPKPENPLRRFGRAFWTFLDNAGAQAQKDFDQERRDIRTSYENLNPEGDSAGPTL